MKYDKYLVKRNRGIYTFRVQGQMYHMINDLYPVDGNQEICSYTFMTLTRRYKIEWLSLIR